MTFYEESTGEAFVSTVDSWNRRRDADRIAWPGPESGAAAFPLFSPHGTLVAHGYLRMVYGDHGPYVEFSPCQIVPRIWVWRMKGPKAWYDSASLRDGSDLKLYMQKKTVATLPNPPRGRWSVANNRPGGYADYRKGRVYISPDHLAHPSGKATQTHTLATQA